MENLSLLNKIVIKYFIQKSKKKISGVFRNKFLLTIQKFKKIDDCVIMLIDKIINSYEKNFYI